MPIDARMPRPADLGETLRRLSARGDAPVHRERDPVAFVHRYADPDDAALVGLYAALLAYGRVELIARALEDATARMGPSPARAAAGDSPSAARERFAGFVYRFTRGDDLSRLWIGAGAVFRAGRTLEDAFLAGDAPEAVDLRQALSGFRRALVSPTADAPPRAAFEHFFPDPERGSATKRLWLYLRWMVRGPDAIDLGLWRRVSPARLTMPVDTHIHRLSRYLGLTRRNAADARTAREITEALRLFDPADPVRFDFGLTHLGISGRCARRRVAEICAECPLDGLCRLDEAGRIAGAELGTATNRRSLAD